MLTDDDKAWHTQRFSVFATREDLARFATLEDLERVETRLLTEFHKWASPNETRLRSFKELLHTFDLEFDQLKDRVKALESKQA